MNLMKGAALVAIVLLSSCAGHKSYFTSDVRARLERDHIPPEKVQFYIDRSVELRREVASRDAKVTDGRVRLVNGKYINIIKLKKGTPGVCTGFYTNSVNVAFESGPGQYLAFGVPAYGNNIYQVEAQNWINGTGKVMYEGNAYFIQPGGVEAKLLIDKSIIDKYDVSSRNMHGRKVQDSDATPASN
ncbi:hypothetical protein [Dinghuibacter silviterrae]|uniref:Lipoprotein n=1 Tax=Dinghuibacter silviterrae TaxID=1539049 RepID=A0A4R8DHL0_9BACT|nr:hypothetical protein [Dinghuibacter silviterrae]TDW97209.1 hypothetical protein EDB95_5054 [Dinghuibacter silviterrae]